MTAPISIIFFILFLTINQIFAMDQLLPLGYPCETLRLKPNNQTIFRSATSPIEVGSCRSQLECSRFGTNRYRTIDGTCNNIQAGKTLWGSKGSEFIRLAPRTRLFREKYPPVFYFVSKDRTLPNARDVSSFLHNGPDERSGSQTTMVMQVGQFLDHDLTLTEEVNLCNVDSCPSKMEIDCCEFINYHSFDADNAPHGCMPILVPDDDEFYSKLFPKVRCLDFKISETTPTCKRRDHGFNGGLSKEPFNSITSFVDGSNIYGSTEEKADKLRSFRGGYLASNEALGNSLGDGDYLPDEEVCPGINPELFFAGDARSNENPGLQSQHTLWLREHNRIASEFQTLRPNWDDEKIFQETRRLVIAEWQHIVYHEFLSEVLGKDFVRLDEKLNVEIDSHYDPDVSPDILMSFSTAAFRFGHSLITSNVNTYRDGALENVYELKNIFFNSSLLKMKGEFNDIIEGMLYQRSELGNSKLTSDIRNFLFNDKDKGFGSDLASRNIQRGRDHELAPYGSFRKLCGLTPLPSSFHHSPPIELSSDIWSKLARIYAEPEDIELFPGGMSEIVINDGLVGPTFACLIAEQFRRLRTGDRYFFTHKNVHRSNQYCDSEREQIRKRTLSDVICDNTDIKYVAKNSFRIPSLDHNPIINCKDNHKLLINTCKEPIPIPHQDELDSKLSTSNMVALMVGGYNGRETLSSVETYSPKGTCQHRLPDFPVRVYNINLMYIGQGKILACGGRTINYGGRHDCWYMNPTLHEWDHLPNLQLNHQRWLSGSAMHYGSWILSGGHESPKTTEILSVDYNSHPNNWAWIPGPKLPGHGRSQHCMVIIYDDMIVMGGFGSGMSVEKYNFNTRQWTSLKSSLIYYRYKHQCVTLPEVNDVLLVGGPHGTVYNLQTEERFLTETPIYSRNYGAVVNLGQRVFALGGDKYSTTVEEYNSQYNKFTVVPYNLKEPRSRFGVVAVPDYLFNGLPGGCKG